VIAMPKIEVPFGPYHPALGEPEYFQVVLEGEQIVAVDFDLGYNYREIEKRVLSFTWPKAVILLGRICGICSSAHTQAFTMAFEKINGMEVPRRARLVRTLGAELERIHSHLLWLGLLGDAAGFDTLFMLSWGAREHALNMLEILSGRRIHYNYLRYGGLYRDVTRGAKSKLKKELAELREKYAGAHEAFMSNEVLESRLRGVGTLSRDKAVEFGVVGPTARGSGVDMDTRRDLPYSAYDEVDFKVPTEKAGDAYARALVRLEEVWQSISIAEQVLSSLPRKSLKPAEPVYESKKGRAAQAVEAPRGENFHFVVAGKKTPEFVRVRPPTFANIFAVTEMLKGHTMSDVPMVINSIDPCFACTDRVVVVDADERTWKEVSL
jgi:Ni,Fe-hydrogenase III large subunit